jgi:carboxypeptidase Taq
MGGFGYFPTYTLGNLNAAQLFSTAMSGRAVSSAARNAEYGPLLAWLRANVHSRGCTLHPGALMKSATGRDTEAAPYLSHLRRRYLS